MGANPTEITRSRWKEILFGSELKSGKAWSVFFARLALGLVFLYSAYGKLVTEWNGGLATMKFLSGSSVASSPLAGLFNAMAGNLAVEYLVVYGELMIAISITFGVLTRVGTVAGMFMMLLFTIAMWPIQGPDNANPFVDIRVIYGVMMLGFFFLRPGRFLGLDGIIQKSRFVQSRPALAKLAAKLG